MAYLTVRRGHVAFLSRYRLLGFQPFHHISIMCDRTMPHNVQRRCTCISKAQGEDHNVVALCTDKATLSSFEASLEANKLQAFHSCAAIG